jgi:prepilin-type N-terminal cleavage/methylation domain-containing protein
MRLWSRSRYGSPEAESGMTMVELLVVMAIMGLVMSAAAAGFISLTNATQSTEERSRANDEVRQAMEQVARDIRAANPIEVQTPVSRYDNSVAFEIFCAPVGGDCAANNLKHVRWTVVDHRLERSVNGGTPRVVLQPDPGSSRPLNERHMAVVNVNAVPPVPVFTFSREDASPLQTADPGPTSAPDLPVAFRDCTRSVRVRLVVITEPGLTSRPMELTTEVSLRNYNEVSAC